LEITDKKRSPFQYRQLVPFILQKNFSQRRQKCIGWLFYWVKGGTLGGRWKTGKQRGKGKRKEERPRLVSLKVVPYTWMEGKTYGSDWLC
jgi:hypothetical protein